MKDYNYTTISVKMPIAQKFNELKDKEIKEDTTVTLAVLITSYSIVTKSALGESFKETVKETLKETLGVKSN